MVQAGVDLYKVQRILRHKSPLMTQRYAHHYPESLRDGVEALEMRRTFSTNLEQSPSCPEASLASCWETGAGDPDWTGDLRFTNLRVIQPQAT